MDNWEQHLYRSHPRETLLEWANRLDLFRFFRAHGGHANDADSLDVAIKYNGRKELVEIFGALGLTPKTHRVKPQQPIPNKSYSGDEMSRFVNELSVLKLFARIQICARSGGLKKKIRDCHQLIAESHEGVSNEVICT